MTPDDECARVRPSAPRERSLSVPVSASPPVGGRTHTQPPSDKINKEADRGALKKHPECHQCGSPWFDAFDGQLRCCNCNAPFTGSAA